MSNKVATEGYDLIIDDFRKQGGVACFIKQILAYSQKTTMRLNTEIIFTEIFLPKSKPFIVSILYKPQDKIDFVNPFVPNSPFSTP